MVVAAIETPASATRRERHGVRMLIGLAVAGFVVASWLGDVALPAVPGFAVVCIVIVTVVQGVAAIRFFGLARSAGERAYLYLGAGSEFVALMGVAWALTSADVQSRLPVLGDVAVGAFIRLSLAVVYGVCLGLSAVVYRTDHPHYPRMRAADRPDPALLVGRTSLGVAALTAAWLAGLILFAEYLPTPAAGAAGVGSASAYPSTWWLVVLLVLACIAMVLPSSLTNSVLFLWELVMLVALAGAIVTGLLARAPYTVAWYSTYVFLLGSAAVLVALLPRLRAPAGPPRVARRTSATAVRVTARAPLRELATADVDERHLELVYQPILDLRRGGVWGFEALLRLQRPDGTRTPAGDFLPALVAEVGAVRVGSIVLDHLARDLPTVTEAPLTRVAVNMSAAELSDASLVERIRSGDLAGYADRLVVEVTEDTLAVPAAASALSDLQQSGVTVAVDDFGSGRSNVALLVAVHPQVIKVDREFIANISEHGSAVIRSAVSLARGLHSVVVAEGVETPAQESALTQLGVQFAQGYALGRPLAPLRRTLSY